MQRHQLRHQRAGGGLRRLRLTGDRHVVERPHRDGHRQPVQGPVHGEELLHRARAHRLQLVHRSGLGSDQRSRQLLRAEPHPHMGEVLVAHAPFPDPAALGDHRPQLFGRGVQIQLYVTLRAGGPADRPTGLRKVFEVVAPHIRHLPLRTATVADQLGDHHSDGRHEHQDTHDPHERRCLRREEEHHRGTHAEHRQDLHQHALLLPARQFGRGLQRQLVRGYFRRQRPRRSFHDDLAHRNINPSIRTGGRPVWSAPTPPWLRSRGLPSARR